MFTYSGSLTTCLAIYPNSSDDWSSSSPFGVALGGYPSGTLTWKDNDDQHSSFAQASDVCVDTINNVTFIAAGNYGLDTYKYATDTGLLTYKDSYDPAAWILGVACDPNHKLIFMANDTDGLVVYSYDANGDNLALVDSDDQGGNAKGIAIDTINHLVYLANGSRGIEVYSYDDSGNLTHEDNDDQGGTANRVAVDITNSRVFLANGSRGLELYSINTTTKTLSHLDNDDQGGDAQDVAVDPNNYLAFLANYGNGMEIYSYGNDPFYDTLSWQNNTPTTNFSLGISCDYENQIVFLCNNSLGVSSYTYTDAGTPTLADSDDQGGAAYSADYDSTNGLMFLANLDRVAESYKYTDTDSAFVFSNSTINNHSAFTLISDRLTDIGKVSNNIDFISKTDIESKKEVQTKGIGGISKLKNFSFKITEGSMTLANIQSLIGRKVVLYYTQTTGVEDPEGSDAVIEFTGEIFKHTRENDEIVFFVKGLLHSANPTVGGNVVETSDGSQKTESIVFGDSGEMYVPLIKKSEDGIYKLHFSQSDDFIIKGLYSKGGSEDEPLYNKIETNYTISDDEIVFSNDEYQNVFLADAIGTGSQFSNDPELYRLNVNATWEIGLTFLDTFTPPAPGTPCELGGLKYGVGSFDLNNTVVYQRTEIVDGISIYIFNCGWELIYGYYGTAIDNRGGDALTYNGATGYLPILNSPTDGWIFIDQRFNGNLKNPLDKERDALPWVSGAAGADDKSNWDYTELMWYLSQRDDQSILDFQLIPNEGLIIKIDDEEMLVIYTEKDSGYSANINPDHPENMYVYVVRGWNNTTIASHSSGAAISVLKGLNQSIIYTYERELQDINTLGNYYDWTFFNKSAFLSGSSDLVVNQPASGYHAPIGYIGLNFRLPDLSGDLHKIYLTGEATAAFDNTNSFTSPDDDYRECSINIAFNSPVDGTKINHRRRAFGENQGESYTYLWAVSYYNYLAGSPKTISGKYNMLLKTSWGFDGTFDSDVHADSKNMHIWQNPGSNEFDFKTYDELKEASMYMVFNGSTRYLKSVTYTVSRPTLKVQMKQRLEDADIYAQVIPKSIFDTPKDTFAIGTNCKIAWNPKGQDDSYDKKDTIMITDDSSRYFGALTLDANSDFDTFYDASPAQATTGILVEAINQPNDCGKIFPSLNKHRYMTSPYDLPAAFSSLRDDYPHGLSDIGKTFLENDLCYFWVDQDNSLIKSVLKDDINVGNPVTIIQDMLNTYYDNVTIDTTAFTAAIAARSNHKMRIQVNSERYLIDLIDQISKEHGLLTYENNDGEMSITTLDPPLTATREISSSELIFVKDLPAFSEEFIDIEYLITELDVYYDYRSNNYKGYIASDDLTSQTYLDEASTYVNNKIKARLNLQTVFESYVANLCAQIKMLYHKSPTRIIKIETTMSTADIHVGQWVTIGSNDFITEITNKIYLVIMDNCQPPFKRNYRRFLTLFEFDITNLEALISEVPDQSVNTNYDEVPNTGTDYEEVPDV